MPLECGCRGPRVPGNSAPPAHGPPLREVGSGDAAPGPAPSPPPLTSQEREGQQQPVEDGAEHVRLHARGARRRSLCRRGATGRRGAPGAGAPWRTGRVAARAARSGQHPGGPAGPRAPPCSPPPPRSGSRRAPPVSTVGARARSGGSLPRGAAQLSAARGGQAGPDGCSAPPSLLLGPRAFISSAPALRSVPAPALPRRPARQDTPSAAALGSRAPPALRVWASKPADWRPLSRARPRETPTPAPGFGAAARGTHGGEQAALLRAAPDRACGTGSPTPGFPGSAPRATAPRVAPATFGLLQET